MKNKTVVWQLVWAYVCFGIFLTGGSLVANSREVADLYLAESIAAEGRFDIPFISGTGDLAMREGRYYVDRGPGNGLAAIPFFFVERALQAAGIEQERALLYAARLAAALFAAIGLFIFMRLCAMLGASAPGTFVAAFALALGTIYWRYATIFYSHVTSAMLLLLSLYLLFRLWNGGKAKFGLSLLLGFVLGFSVLVEYANAIVVLLVLLFLVFKNEEAKSWPERGRRVLPVVLGGLAPLVFLLIYHTVCFGSPFSTGFSHQIYFNYNKQLGDAFSTPWRVGVPGLLFSLRYQGLFFISPIALLGFAGLAVLYAKHRRPILLAGMIFVAMLLFYGKYRAWWGATSDTRYLVPVIPLLFLGLPVVVEYILDAAKNLWKRTAILLIFVLFLARSLFFGFLSVATFYDHDLRTDQLVRLLLLNDTTEVTAALKAAFPSHAWSLPFILLLAIPLLSYLALSWRRGMKSRINE